MIQAATSQKGASANLQTSFNDRIERAELLNVRFAPGKSKLMHLSPEGQERAGGKDSRGIQLYDIQIEPKTCITALGVWIDHCRSF